MPKIMMEIQKINMAFANQEAAFSKLEANLVELRTRINEFENGLYKALIKAAEEAYHSEVEQTEMVDLWIGTGKEFANKEDWMEQRIEEWLS